MDVYNFSSSRFCNHEVTVTAISRLVHAFEASSSLENLDLDFSGYAKLDDAVFENIGESLKTFRFLKNIGLDFNQ